MQLFFPTALCNVTAWRHSRLRAHWLMALVGGGGWVWLRKKYVFCVPRGIAASPIWSFVYGRSLWAELNGGENPLHWKANICSLYLALWLWFTHWLPLCLEQLTACYDLFTCSISNLGVMTSRDVIRHACACLRGSRARSIIGRF